MRAFTAFVAGFVFSIGLVISEMVNPAKVLGFLDLFGQWDPSLAFVMGGALLVTAIGYRMVTKAPQPVFAQKFHIPTNRSVDAKLASGSVLFGIGWGLAGLCPGPALAALSFGGVSVLVFLASMFAGAWLYQILLVNRRSDAGVVTT
ncbi:MAG: DUF6691 family protein [Pseudomonadota bacterium]